MATTHQKPRIDILAGPTASGKTALALRWAESWDAEILSADASLFYRGMDIGTAKPTAEERARVPHHLIDICAVHETFAIGPYVAAAQAAVQGILARKRRVLVVGGSGFYLASFFQPVVDSLPIPDAVREEVARLEQSGGTPALRERLLQVEPSPPAWLDLANPRRLARALERRLTTGTPLELLAQQFKAQPHPFQDYDCRLWRLAPDRAELHARITRRTASMLEAGLVEEVRALAASGLRSNPSAASAIGYRECLDHLDGRLPLEALPEAINSATRRLVRRQETWLRHKLPPAAIVDHETPAPD